jgi:uncharacterized membrane protein
MPPQYEALVGGAGSGGVDAPSSSLPLAALAVVFLASLVAFVTLDGIWIGFVAKGFYASHLAPAGVLRPDADLLAALLSWVCIVAANALFVLPRTFGNRSAMHALRQGALLGVCLYGTVDFTNAALIRGWGWPVALVDVLWGTTACAVTALAQNRLAHAAAASAA